ncbi:hypothetical protein IFM89_003992 [Coptis chinensis]|uniref:Uncharacterized protein n=1 Tax=Coptis chinensis TaxID=261450 RepID=A0A835I002_9MAGN|nr:hypothetical protein IFM89_003992 [Coptis chinensis]
MANIANQEQAMFKKNSDEALARVQSMPIIMFIGIYPKNQFQLPVSTTPPPPYMNITTGGYLDTVTTWNISNFDKRYNRVLGQVSQCYYAVPQGGYSGTTGGFGITWLLIRSSPLLNYGDAMLTRFLVARLMNPMKAVKMLVSWKKWREEFVPLGFIPDSKATMS